MARLRGSPQRPLLFVLKLVQVKAKQLAILELKLQPHNLSRNTRQTIAPVDLVLDRISLELSPPEAIEWLPFGVEQPDTTCAPDVCVHGEGPFLGRQRFRTRVTP